MSATTSPLKNSTCWLAVCLSMVAFGVATGAELTRTDRALRFGLQRAWFSQVRVDATRSHVVDWKLRNDRLYALTSAGVLQAMDAETGATLWTKRVGRPQGSFTGLAINEDFLAVISGSKLHLFDRALGHMRVTHHLESAPITAPVLSERYVFAAMASGKIEGYSLDFPEQQPWFHQTIGRVFYEPTVTGEVVSWPSDRGFLYVSQANQPRVLYRVETGGEIVAPPAELEPYLYVTSRDGYIYCVNELSGTEAWKWSTGYPIIAKPAAVAATTYVASEEPALHALHYKTGQLKWMAPGLKQFVAEGKTNVYGLDRLNRLVIVEKETGGILGSLWAGEDSQALVNDQSDRIFLVSRSGLVQCFHESQSPEPTYYRLQPVEETEEEDESDVNPFGEQPTEDAFTTDDSPGDDGGSPFGTPVDEGFGTDDPGAGSGEDEENPFDF